MAKNTKIRTRFAPSPTGYLHIGGLRTALYAYLYAKKHGGDFVLRIEDTDQVRLVEGAVEMIIRSLSEAGIKCDEGPDIGGKYGPYVQSERIDTYAKYAKELVSRGGAYYCFCTKDRLDKIRGDGASKYDKFCLSLSAAEVKERLAKGEQYCIRQNVPSEGKSTYVDMLFGQISVDYKDIEDGVLIKSDGYATYNFANVVDDHLMAINVVIRGTEYLSSTPKYNLIYDGLGWQRPQYIHLQPIMRDSQHKLSKRDGDASLDDFLSKGYLRDAIINYIALLGWSPKDNREKLTLSEMQELFSVDGLSKSNSIFDINKLRWLNAQYIKELDVLEFHRLMQPFYAKLKYLSGYDLELISSLIQGRLEVLGEADSLIGFLDSYQKFDTELLVSPKQKTDIALAKSLLPKLVVLVKSTPIEELHEALSRLATDSGLKLGAVMWVFRIAITGCAVTPGGATDMAKLIGKERMIERLEWLAGRL